MSNKKEVLHVKSNGLRNELKEIRKSIDRLTDAIILAQSNKHQVFRSYDPPYTITSDAQTHKRYEKDYSNPPNDNGSSDDWGMYDYE